MTIPQDCVDDTANLMSRIEEHIDATLILCGQLAGELVRAQTQGRVHPMLLHEDLFEKLPGLIASATTTRGAAVEMHRGMNSVAKRMGLERTMDGGGPVPKDWFEFMRRTGLADAVPHLVRAA